MEDRNLKMAHRIAEAVQRQGGRVFYAGGYVRDRLSGKVCRDIDLEAHGVSAGQLERILKTLGVWQIYGASFEIMALRGYDLDISRNGDCSEADLRAAAARRDFTVNAMMEDVLTGEVLDFFGGREDLKQGLLRCTCPETFGEDPLRVFRAARFAACHGFRLTEETEAVCRGLDVSALAGERVEKELERALLTAEKPSIFFEVLRRVDRLHDWFPEVEALIGVEQEPRFHPEGDVWNHTMMVVDAAASLRDGAQQPLGYMLSALCHDFGKVDTTKVVDGRIRSLFHEKAGLPRARHLLKRLMCGDKLKRYVLNMTELHMRPNILASSGSSQKAVNRLLDESVCPEDLILLAKADRLGQGITESYEEKERYLQNGLAAYRKLMAQPGVTGADLQAAGISPSPLYGELLAYAHKLKLAGVPKANALKQTLALARKKAKQQK